ncbi:flavanone 3-dioxygenase 3 [Carica papaya]|uniref:flavanone 3-dioxygenase 3 n=1 Tax=Carica papaya TaxID=3649 RepID=UPI000B8D0B55|nr:flavanone 3-dioxygenase 3 [Carica papaya]
MGNSAQEKGLPYVPDCYLVPMADRPNLAPSVANIPVIDLAKMPDTHHRSTLISQLSDACRRLGFFQIVNHGISESVMEGALKCSFEYFKLPGEEKTKLMSNDVFKPVRYGTSMKDGVDSIQYWRVFLKHYAYPLHSWTPFWPHNPPDYRKKMGKYCSEVRRVALELMGAITESLGLGSDYLGNRMEEGMQVMAVNCYPPCPEPEVALGLPPHSDYSCLTILLQSLQGLEILDKEDGNWKVVPELHGALQVHVGDHLEVLSNGRYKSVVHRATLNSDKTRVSITSLHSLGMDDVMGAAMELVDNQNPLQYKESSFRDFLDFLSSTDISGGKRFIDTIRLEK